MSDEKSFVTITEAGEILRRLDELEKQMKLVDRFQTHVLTVTKNVHARLFDLEALMDATQEKVGQHDERIDALERVQGAHSLDLDALDVLTGRISGHIEQQQVMANDFENYREKVLSMALTVVHVERQVKQHEGELLELDKMLTDKTEYLSDLINERTMEPQAPEERFFKGHIAQEEREYIKANQTDIRTLLFDADQSLSLADRAIFDNNKTEKSAAYSLLSMANSLLVIARAMEGKYE